MRQTETSKAFSSDPAWTEKFLSIRRTPLYSRMITFSQVLADVLCVFFCFLGSLAIYTQVLQKTSPQTLFEYLVFTGVAALIYVLVADRVGLYRREVSLLNVKELRGIVRLGIYSAAIILSATFYFKSLEFSRLTLTTAFVATPCFLYLNRQVFYRIHLWLHQQGWGQKRVVIFGAGNIGIHLAKRLFESPSLGLFPLGFLDDDPGKTGTQVRWTGIGGKKGLPILGNEDWLIQHLGKRQKEVDQVLIAMPSASFERNQKLVDFCAKNEIEYAIVPNAYEPFIQRVELFELGGIPLIRRKAGEVGIWYLIGKRLVDFALSSVFLLALSPFILLFSLLIKWDSPGPVIFKQKRVGYRGKEFSFYKFRTMYVEAPKYARSPTDPKDSRITKLGRWLRRTSLDELPQLYNVWRGDMSLVGPRPEMPFVVAQYTALERQRLEAKPGITGVWQISAARAEPIHHNLEYDLFYIENRSMLLDLAIIIKTIYSVIRGIGAV